MEIDYNMLLFSVFEKSDREEKRVKAAKRAINV